MLKGDDAGSGPRVLNADGARRPLFFFHGDYLSGGLYVRKLASQLGPDQPLVPISPCGRVDDRVPPSYEEMAGIHLKQILDVQAEGPYWIGGVCNGGLVALEVSHLLMKQGKHVDRLVLIDASASNVRFRWLFESLPLRALSVAAPELSKRTFLFLRHSLAVLEGHTVRSLARRILGRIAGLTGLAARAGPNQEVSSIPVVFGSRMLRDHY